MGPIAAVIRMGKGGFRKEHKYALKEFNALMDQYRREDREAGRSAQEIVMRKMRQGWTAADLFTPKEDHRLKHRVASDVL